VAPTLDPSAVPTTMKLFSAMSEHSYGIRGHPVNFFFWVRCS